MNTVRTQPIGCPAARGSQRGFTMVELMVALLLGLVLIGGVINVFLTSGQTLRVNQNLSRVHENARFAIEMFSREIREAGMVPCGSTLSANVLRGSGGSVPWWASTYDGMVRGFDDGQNSTAIKGFGASTADRVGGTDALLILRPSSDEADLRRLASHDPAENSFTDASVISTAVKSRYDSRPALVCDGKSAALLQIGAASVSLGEYDYGTGTYNCSMNLGSADAACATTTPRTFDAGAQLTRWDPAFWYIGHNARGTKSLYRVGIKLNSSTGAVENDVQEMVPDVENMQIDYLTRNRDNDNVLATDWVAASAFTGGWTSTTAEVVAARVKLTLRSTEAVGEGNVPLTRTFVILGSIRNREI
ncbi:PilW family protein [Acidovorax sp. IB03]|jgi:type IV pilus assembly protein PilW|uniref:PilW family protein n=1 Tax=Acidovorax sp. IB03 TaxID=2779366 RepID=UPI00210541E5|nr:PilW family protein [Acidovorax sp. IB03]